MNKNYFLPLKEVEIESIKKGKTIVRIFKQGTIEPLSLMDVKAENKGFNVFILSEETRNKMKMEKLIRWKKKFNIQ